MTDVSACVNTTCPLRHECFRYRLVYGPWQSAAWFAPGEDGTCQRFDRVRDEASPRVLTREAADARMAPVALPRNKC